MSKSAPVMGALWGHRGDLRVWALPGLLVHLGSGAGGDHVLGRPIPVPYARPSEPMNP